MLPNLLGSILFLISAADGLLEVGHGRLLVFEPQHLGWWIAMVNALGCLWFMQSALAAWPSLLRLVRACCRRSRCCVGTLRQAAGVVNQAALMKRC